MSFTCANPALETVVHLNMYDDPRCNNFTLDSPTIEFTSSGSYLQIVELGEALIVQATAVHNPKLFAHITLDRVVSQKIPTVVLFGARIRINQGTVLEIPLNCQGIGALVSDKN